MRSHHGDRAGFPYCARGDIPWLRQPPWPLPALDLPINSLSIMRCQRCILGNVHPIIRARVTPRQLQPPGGNIVYEAHNQSGLYLSQGGICLRRCQIAAALARRLIDCKVSSSIFEE